jgi:hypothetical protein
MGTFTNCGSLGTSTNNPHIDDGTSALCASAVPGSLGLAAKSMLRDTHLTEEERLLAAGVFGEGSTANVFEEMAAIGAVLVRQAEAHSMNLLQFLKSKDIGRFSLVFVDGSARFNALKNATDEAVAASSGMSSAVLAARHALTKQLDYSNGAYFWDGLDLKTNLSAHPKVLKGIRFSDPAHDIFKIGDKKITEVVEYWYDKKGHRTRERGRYSYTFESTAAYGSTVFWRFTPEYLKATGGKEYLG